MSADSVAFLAPGAAASTLLPLNTQIFASSMRLPRLWYIVATIGGLLAAISLVVGAVGVPATAKGPVLGTAAGVLAATLAVLLAIRQLALKSYAAALASGSHHEGIVLFPSGDVVVRFSGVFASTDRTIEAAFLSRAQVTRRCSPTRLRPRNYLQLFFVTLDARPSVITVCEDDLRDSVARIADAINDCKARNAAAHSSFGGALGFGGLGML